MNSSQHTASLQIRSTPTRWGAIAKLLHWIIVILLLGQFVLAHIDEHALPFGLDPWALHKTGGITILGLAVLRLAWRLFDRNRPPLPADLKPYERALARLTHYGLYVLLFAQPLIGWATASAKDYPVAWFGIDLPLLAQADKALGALLAHAHATVAIAIVALTALHVLGALQHHFIRKDSVLRRMLPFVNA